MYRTILRFLMSLGFEASILPLIIHKKKFRIRVVSNFPSALSRNTGTTYHGSCVVSGYIKHGTDGTTKNGYGKKRVREKSRECHNYKQQPYPDTKRKKNQITPNKHKSTKRTKSTKISSLFPKRGNRNGKRTEKTQEQNNTKLRHKTNRLVE